MSVGRPLRVLPAGAMVEVTTRCQQSRLLLRPSSSTNRTVLGVLGRALSMYEVSLHGFCAMSNHLEMLTTPASAGELASFMRFVNREISRRVGGWLVDWREGFWGRRYRHIVAPTAEDELDRLRYLMAQGCKENLVWRPQEWPGAASHRALTRGERLVGYWVDRTAMTRHGASELEATTAYPIELASIPSLAHLARPAYRRVCADLAQEITKETAARHRADGTRPLGVRAVRRMHPHSKPHETNRTPAPLVHARNPVVRRAYRRMIRLAEQCYRRIMRQLHATAPAHPFPAGMIVPPFLVSVIPPAPWTPPSRGDP